MQSHSRMQMGSRKLKVAISATRGSAAAESGRKRVGRSPGLSQASAVQERGSLDETAISEAESELAGIYEFCSYIL